MSIAITPIVRSFTYNGILLPDVPGLTPREVRDLYSAQYPELVSAEVEAGEVANGRQDFTFRKAVGTKGAGGSTEAPRLTALAARIEAEANCDSARETRLSRSAQRPGIRAQSEAWRQFAAPERVGEHRERNAAPRVEVPSELLAPLP